MGALRKSKFLDKGTIITPPYQFSFKRAGPWAISWTNLTTNPKHFRGATAVKN